MREEVISPFRTIRMFFYAAFIGSAALGALVTLPRIVAALSGVPGADAKLNQILQDIGIDIAAVAIFGLLYRNDLRAKDTQLARLSREESLSQLRLELASGRVVRVADLRGACRLVILAGPLSDLRRAVAFAQPFRGALLERGVTVVPYVTRDDRREDPMDSVGVAVGSLTANFGSFASLFEAGLEAWAPPAETAVADDAAEGAAGRPLAGAQSVSGATVDPADPRWLARPLYTQEWDAWLREQLRLANIAPGNPVYISLRLDGRVRGSGVGYPRWQVIAAQLPPLKGIWKGPFDGMDGRVF